MKTCLLTLLVLIFAASGATCQTTYRAPTPRAAATLSGEWLPASQQRVIGQALKRFEELKNRHADLVQRNYALRVQHVRDSITLRQRWLSEDQVNRAYFFEQTARQQAEANMLLWQARARRRGVWLRVSLAVPAAYGGYRLARSFLQ